MLYETLCVRVHTPAFVCKSMERSGFPFDQVVGLVLAIQQEEKLLKLLS